MKKLIFIGAGGYAKSALDSLPHGQYEFVGFIDRYREDKPSCHLGFPILGNYVDDLLHPEQYAYFVTIGANEQRKMYFDFLRERGYEIINIIDATALVSSRARIGTGVFVGKLAIVNSGACVGDDSILNTRSLTEHGCCIEEHVNLSTNAVINGDVIVHNGAFIGSCSVVNGQLSVGAWATVGSGAVVVRDVEAGTTVVGIPARIIKRRRQ